MYLHPAHGYRQSFQNTDSPDYDMENDLINGENNAATGLGMENSEIAAQRSIRVNVATILISAFIFLAILAWFDFFQTTFYEWSYPPSTQQEIPSQTKFWYALFVSFIVAILVLLVYYHFSN